MTKAEERALEAYPPKRKEVSMTGAIYTIVGGDFERRIFQQGYEQAEKDLALTWEDIRKIVVLFSEVSFECFDTKSANEMCEETLTRFKQYKEEQK